MREGNKKECGERTPLNERPSCYERREKQGIK